MRHQRTRAQVGEEEVAGAIGCEVRVGARHGQVLQRDVARGQAAHLQRGRQARSCVWSRPRLSRLETRHCSGHWLERRVLQRDVARGQAAHLQRGRHRRIHSQRLGSVDGFGLRGGCSSGMSHAGRCPTGNTTRPIRRPAQRPHCSATAAAAPGTALGCGTAAAPACRGCSSAPADPGPLVLLVPLPQVQAAVPPSATCCRLVPSHSQLG